jgi:polyisoprenoid-binding protein YceI
MKQIIVLILALISANSFSNECLYSVEPSSVKVSWAAYKTPIKAAVGGSFTKVSLTNQTPHQENSKSLLKTQFVIDTTSTSTNDKMRDANIVNSFFKLMKGGTNITGQVLSIDSDLLTVQITMNKVTKKIPLKLTIIENSITASGHIDVLDFSMAKSLKGINKACYDLHEGKTWSDVAIKLEAKLLKKCN